MKKIQLLIVCFFTIKTLLAQSGETEMDFSVFVDEVFSGIDRNKVSSGILYDKSFSYTKIDRFTGTENSDTLNYNTWKQIMHEMYYAHLDAPQIPKASLMDSMAAPLISAGTIPLGIIALNYHKIKANAFENGWLMVEDNIIKETPGSGVNPYEAAEVFVSCPMIQNLTSGTYSLVLSPVCYFSNYVYPDYIEVDVQNGMGFQIYDWGEPIILNYDENSNKIIYVKAYFGSKILYSFAVIKGNSGVNKQNKILKTTANKTTATTITVIPPDNGGGDGLGEAISSSLTNVIGHYGIWFGCENDPEDKILDKPFLLVEGFDFDDSRDFETNDPEKNLYHIANGLGLMDRLRADGYDIIILNFDDGFGANDIRENALLTVTLIDTINNRKINQYSSNHELIVGGPSAGAQITRYALAWMEENNLEHHTKLWLSFDGEHQGAYVPLGMQHMINFLANTEQLLFGDLSIEVILLREKLLNNDQAKQMLLYHYSQTDNGTAGPHPDFNTFYDEYNSINGDGYPHKCRNIAIANGSVNATTQGLPGNQINFLDLTLLNGLINVDISVKTLPDNPADEQTFITAIAAVGPIPVNILVKKIKNNVPFENVPGGTQEHQKALDIVLGGPVSAGDLTYLRYDGVHAFVPTISSLDINASDDYFYNVDNAVNNTFGIAKVGNGYINYNSSLTPFDAFYASPANEKHVIGGIVAPVDDWFLEETSPNDLYLQNQMITTNTDFEARNTITTGENVTDKLNQGPFIVSNNAQVTMTAGEKITFLPGTLIQDGSNLLASIEPYSCIPLSAKSNLVFDNDDNDILIQQPEQNNEDPFYEFFKFLEDEVLVYPNPANSSFIVDIQHPDQVAGKLQILNSFGQLIEELAILGNKVFVDFSDKNEGIYFVRIPFTDHTSIKKVVYQQ